MPSIGFLARRKACRATVVIAFAAAMVLASLPGARAQTPIRGAGATFPMPLYLEWAKAYAQEAGKIVSYEGVGSGEGIRRVEAGTVAFGASDRLLSSGVLAAAGLVQFPTLVGGVLPVVSLPGIDPGALTLDGSTLGQILAQRIVWWDAPAIARLNPAYHLPHLAIVVVHRSDASGTTFVLSDYLARTTGGWLGRGTTVPWPGGTAVVGSRAMVEAVRGTPGAIGYVDYADAKRGALAYVAPAALLAQASGETCPHCTTPRIPGARFCEVCRHDFVTEPGEAQAAAPPAAPAAPRAPVASDPDLAAQAFPGRNLWATVTPDRSLMSEAEKDVAFPASEPPRSYPLDLDENLVGRRNARAGVHPEIAVDDPSVSSRHLKICRRKEGTLYVVDVGSSNGTKVNGRTIEPGIEVPLAPGDRLTLGMWTSITVEAR